MFYTGRLRLEVQSRTLLYTIVDIMLPSIYVPQKMVLLSHTQSDPKKIVQESFYPTKKGVSENIYLKKSSHPPLKGIPPDCIVTNICTSWSKFGKLISFKSFFKTLLFSKTSPKTIPGAIHYFRFAIFIQILIHLAYPAYGRVYLKRSGDRFQ